MEFENLVNANQRLSFPWPKMFSIMKEGGDWKAKFKTVADFYADDLPNRLSLDAELLLWRMFWEQHAGPHPSNIATTLKAIKFDGFEKYKGSPWDFRNPSNYVLQMRAFYFTLKDS